MEVANVRLCFFYFNPHICVDPLLLESIQSLHYQQRLAFLKSLRNNQALYAGAAEEEN